MVNSVISEMQMQQGVVYGDTIMETGETVQASPSDSVITEDQSTVTGSTVVEPPEAAPAEDN